jgi:NADH-quinone oxidoreductase subunit E
MAPIRVYEVASFYSMFNLAPVGKNFIQLCGTTPCWLRGAAEIMDVCKKKLNIDKGGTTSDGMFTLVEVECLGACANAPLVQINDDYYEDLTADSMSKIIDDLKQGKEIKSGSQIGRSCSAPIGELTILQEDK